MARPVEPTPILSGKDAERFETLVRENQGKPAKLVETPRLEEVAARVREHALKMQK